MGSEGGGMSSGSAGSEGGSGAGQAGGEPDQLGKGRYVEKQETLPQELQDRSIIQMYTAEGKLRLLATEQENGKTIVSEWEKQGEGFTEVTQGWLAAMDLPAADWIELGIAQGEGGTQYLYAGYQAEDEESFRTRLWKGQGDTALEITPREWTVPNETTGGYEIVTRQHPGDGRYADLLRGRHRGSRERFLSPSIGRQRPYREIYRRKDGRCPEHSLSFCPGSGRRGYRGRCGKSGPGRFAGRHFVRRQRGRNL